MKPKEFGLADLKLAQTIQILLKHHRHLLSFLFSPNGGLRLPADRLSYDARAFSHGEYILVQLALDLWCGTNRFHMGDALSVLDDDNFISFLRALMRFRELDVSCELFDPYEEICSD